MTPTILFFQLTIALTAVNCLPLRHSTDTGSDDLSERLSKLKSLLERLEEAKITRSNLTKDLDIQRDGEGSIETMKGDTDTSNEITGTYKHTENINIKNFVDSLTPQELQKLKILKSLVEESKNAREGNMENKVGLFSEKEVPESGETGSINWKELVSRLEQERDHLYLQNIGTGENTEHVEPKSQVEPIGKQPLHVETETQEGTFGAFRDEIKYAVEKNLLSDVALALHSGITVEELINDITQPGKQ